MTEIVIRNKEILQTLDDTLEKFLEHRDLMTELATSLKGVPIGDGEQYCKPDHLWNVMRDEHIGFPEEGYGFQVTDGVTHRPEIFKPLEDLTKNQLPRVFGANGNSLTAYYPPKGFVGWHTNWNAFGYQIILTWSESGDGYFTYYDKKNNEFVKHEDVKGWQARYYRFGRKDEPEHHCWHAAWTECPRFTLAFKFPYGKYSEFVEHAREAQRDLVELIEQDE